VNSAPRQQCKDIPDRPILELLARSPGEWHNWFEWPGNTLTVRLAMPPRTPDKLALAKMRQLLRRGLVDGCGCGCRGDFEITNKGLAFLAFESPLLAPSSPTPETP
jgi:hypothetical protein